MKKTPKPDTPEARLQEMRARMNHAREVKLAVAAKKNAPACHPERVQLGKTGLCHECYVGSNAAKNLSLQDAMKLAERHADPAVAATIRNQSLAILMENLPEYARMHFEAAKMAALKGNATPAEWALTMIKSAGQPAVVDIPKNVPVDGGVKIFVGVRLGGLSEPSGVPGASKELEAHAETVPIEVSTD